jgi:hypothetical protein
MSSAHDDLERFVGQGPLERLGVVPGGAHPDLALLLRRQDDGHRLRMHGVDDGVRRRREEAVDEVRAGIGLDFVPRSPLNSVQMPAKQNSGRLAADTASKVVTDINPVAAFC